MLPCTNWWFLSDCGGLLRPQGTASPRWPQLASSAGEPEPAGQGYGVHSRHPWPWQTVRTDRWRYARWSDGTAELYDEANDREETHDLANELRNRPTVETLETLLDGIGPFHSAPSGEENRVPGKQVKSK